jgi:hypothetical protein
LIRILCCPARSPSNVSSRLLGGLRKSCKLMAALIWSSLRVATRLSDAGQVFLASFVFLPSKISRVP